MREPSTILHRYNSHDVPELHALIYALQRTKPGATLPAELVSTGRTESGIVMAVQHRELPLHGVQFHPESVLTQGGHRMLANWLAMCGMPEAVQRSHGLAPLVTR